MLKTMIKGVSIILMIAAFYPLNSNVSSANQPNEGFEDHFDFFNPELWYRSDGWANGADFGVGWLNDHVEFSEGKMALRLDDAPNNNDKPYTSGEFYTLEKYGYGRIEGRIKVAKGVGLVTSLFTYSPNADEIDIEILGKDTTKLETNFFIGGVRGKNAHAIIDLGFDASEDFHDYAIEWSANYIKWFVDGELVRTVEGDEIELPSEPSSIMANLWSGAGAAARTWTGEFVYPGSPVRAYYDYIKFTPEKDDSTEPHAVSLEYMKELLDNYIAAGEVSGPLANQLMNNLKQAQHHNEKEHQKQAIKSMGDFIKHINNKGMQKHITLNAQKNLHESAEALIQLWSD
ncbi:family 16 glycosylhydrolase [Bacillus sp. FJAT-49711]|uniref:family 16 glycosylhydrolase n=1 Tax=Bacillus sp. FJAT-49711 TaxID=2833585 RepID=UPI001BCA372C|nr:family 16 glycosylhydrolase [Bacillus sp. FJAT-49711]MBS4220664.1 family 16 glycosylhydrolase [Bacillus sp. FJAT-49711]